MNVREGAEKRKPPYTVGGDMNWCSCYGEQYEADIQNEM